MAMFPATLTLQLNSMRHLEIRINTPDDIKAVIQNCVKIEHEAKDLKMDAINLVTENTIRGLAIKELTGVFQFKAVWSFTRAQDDATFFPVPHYQPAKVLQVRAPAPVESDVKPMPIMNTPAGIPVTVNKTGTLRAAQ